MNAPVRQGISYQPVDRDAYDREQRRRAARSFVRACCAALLTAAGEAKNDPAGASGIAEKMWPRDRDTGHVLKAAQSPATMTSASVLAAQQVLVSFVSSLAPVSAAAALVARGIKLDFSRSASILVPNIVPPVAAFIGEGAPIPVEQETVGGPILTPFKLAAIVTFNRELAEISAANVEALVGAALRQAVASRLDAVMFGNAAASSVAPAGILNSISATTASAVTPVGEAMVMDLAKLAGSVARTAGGEIIFICAPEQAASIALRAPGLPYAVLSTPALTAGTVVASPPMRSLPRSTPRALKRRTGHCCISRIRRHCRSQRVRKVPAC